MSKPLVHYNHMYEITQAEQRKLCRCVPRCIAFLVITYTRGPVLTMCETNAKIYINEIAVVLGLKGISAKRVFRPWEPEEIEKLKDHYKKWAGKYGYAKELSKTMNRTPQQIIQKAKYLKARGEL